MCLRDPLDAVCACAAVEITCMCQGVAQRVYLCAHSLRHHTQTRAQWLPCCCRLAGVRYLQGSPHDAETLALVRVDAAAVAVVLLPWDQPGVAADSQRCDEDAAAAGMVDAVVVAAVHLLRSVGFAGKLFCELGRHSSVAFLDPHGSLLDGCATDEAAVAAATSPCMAGHVLVPSVLDSLLCQSVTTPAVPRILDGMLAQWYKQPAGAPMLLQVLVQHCPCDTFGELFAWLMQRCMLCCALDRQAVHEGRVVRYCYTNPHKVRAAGSLCCWRAAIYMHAYMHAAAVGEMRPLTHLRTACQLSVPLLPAIDHLSILPIHPSRHAVIIRTPFCTAAIPHWCLPSPHHDIMMAAPRNHIGVTCGLCMADNCTQPAMCLLSLSLSLSVQEIPAPRVSWTILRWCTTWGRRCAVSQQPSVHSMLQLSVSK